MLGAAIAVGLGLAGAGAFVQADASRDVARGQRQAEAIRQRQMAVQADRERRQAIRQAMQARAQANAAITSQGASFSSAQAGLGQQVADAGQQVGATNINENLGSLMFAANNLISRGQMQANIGQAIGGFGATILGSSQQIGRVGNSLFGAQNAQQSGFQNGTFGGAIGFGMRG